MLTPLSYDQDGGILILDPRVNPLTFDGLFLKSVVDSVPVFLPLDYLIINAVESLPVSVETPTVAVSVGFVNITDPERNLLLVTSTTNSVLAIKLRP